MAKAATKARKKPTSKAKPAKTASTLKQEVTRSAYASLKPHKRAFVDNYIEPTEDTFSNGTRSYHKAVNGRITIESARSTASTLLSTDNVRNAIEERLEYRGASEDVRIGVLAEIATGKFVKQVRTTFTTNGKVKSQIEVESTPSAADVVRVNNLIYKVTGKYDTNKAIADVLTARTKQLMKQFKPKQSVDSKA